MSVDDARNTVSRLAQDAQRQAQGAANRQQDWQAAVRRLRPVADGIVAPLRDAGVPDIYVDGYRNALAVKFGSRPYAIHPTANGFHADAAEGAELLIIMEEDGALRALQRPYYPDGQRPVYQTVAEFAHPADATDDRIADIVADFLRWVVGGDGTGGLPIRFF